MCAKRNRVLCEVQRQLPEFHINSPSAFSFRLAFCNIPHRPTSAHKSASCFHKSAIRKNKSLSRKNKSRTCEALPATSPDKPGSALNCVWASARQ